MNLKERKYEQMVFNYKTTSLTDYRDGEIKPVPKTQYKGKPRCLRTRQWPLKDLHTMNEWKNNNVPFDLMVNPKEIVHSNPRAIQKPYLKIPDEERDEAQKTRPRVVMTPAVRIDDMPDPKEREILVQDMYTTTVMKALQESAAAFPSDNFRAPYAKRPAPTNPITLPLLQPAYVSPEWRMDTVTWDNKQLRADCMPTREFWLRRSSPKCDVCSATAARVAQKKMLQSMTSQRRPPRLGK